MTVRSHNLESVGELYATFTIHQTAGADDLADDDIGRAVTITDDYEIGPGTDGAVLLGKLTSLTLQDGDDGDRLATVQIGGVCTLPIAATYPTIGDRVVCAADGAVKQAPALGSSDPAGGNVARGTVLAVSGTSECLILLN
jgi:hypothetical protein